MKKYTIVLDNGHRINIKSSGKLFQISNPDYSGNPAIFDKLFSIPKSTLNGVCLDIQKKMKSRIINIE